MIAVLTFASRSCWVQWPQHGQYDRPAQLPPPRQDERAARSGSDQPILASIPKRTAPGWGEPGACLSEAFGGNLAP
jgi:hypothetical protein